MNAESSLARKTAALPISMGSAIRPMGVRVLIPSMISGLVLAISATRGVLVTPGQMQFTRMPALAYSAATVLVIMSTAPLAAQYGVRVGKATRAATDAVLMIDPPPAAAMMPTAWCMPSHTPLALMDMTL